jgi:hypothetical protein
MVPAKRNPAGDSSGVIPRNTVGRASRLPRSQSGRLRYILFALIFTPPLHAWQETLSNDAAGPFAEVPAFRAEFRIGWSEIEAARAHAAITYDKSSSILSAGGGTTGWARSLYQLDATYHSVADRQTLQTTKSSMVETEIRRTLTTLVEGANGQLSTFSESIPPGSKPPKWKMLKVAPVRDLYAGMLFIRSQKLDPGDIVRLVIFPGGSPFLVEIESRGPERVLLADGPRDALRLNLKIQRVNTKKGNTLEPHSKFRSGKIWLSNDSVRLPLRAEVDIFIGYVFAEIAQFEWLKTP